MLGYKFNKIWRPEVFQGASRKRNYFEGWYFKLIDSLEKNVLAIIPGISIGENEKASHAFIQIIDGKTNNSHYITYDRELFSYSKNKFEIRIENNYFSMDKIKLSIDKEDEYIKGELSFSNLTPWPSSVAAPGTMGWYTFVPFMECYHGCLSMTHNINGILQRNNNKINFDGGKGYIEKDWGTSFPSSWIWCQSNHFNETDTSIMVSIANIPWIGSHFVGFIVGFYHKNKFYKFATYTGAKLNKIYFEDDKAHIEIKDTHMELKLILSQSSTGKLYSPIKGQMLGEVKESMSSEIYISLFDLKTRDIIFEGTGKNSGLEIMGDLKEIIKSEKNKK